MSSLLCSCPTHPQEIIAVPRDVASCLLEMLEDRTYTTRLVGTESLALPAKAIIDTKQFQEHKGRSSVPELFASPALYLFDRVSYH